MNFKNVLFLSPHTDDSEIGAGGFMNKLVDSGSVVHHYAFSDCVESVPFGYESDTLKKEFFNSCNFLNLANGNFECFDFKVRNFDKYRQEILDLMIGLRNKVQPDLVVCPSLKDFHQDHQVIATESIRAFKNTNIIHYEMPWNMLNVETKFFVQLNKNQIDKKISLISNYKSQAGRGYTDANIIKAHAIARGGIIGKSFSELFEVSRWII